MIVFLLDSVVNWEESRKTIRVIEEVKKFTKYIALNVLLGGKRLYRKSPLHLGRGPI